MNSYLSRSIIGMSQQIGDDRAHLPPGESSAGTR